MSFFETLNDKFTISIMENFPVEECNINDKFEENVFLSDSKYLCLIINKHNKFERKLCVMSPYIAMIKEKDTFGWTTNNNDSDNYIDNYWNGVHSKDSEDYFVIGFMDYSDNDEENDMILWDNFE